MKKKRESITMATIASKEELTQQLRAVAHMMTVKQEEEAYQYLNLLITQLEAGKDNCDSCGQLEWLCICEPNCVSCDKVDYLCKCEPIEALS
jgi:hypothetical protein